ncbi:MAG: hypothetical protein F6K55_24055, partial [Moorea sp. SIO4A3]|nr:hypothetical protein [Moorena sp. SIO4A3]
MPVEAKDGLRFKTPSDSLDDPFENETEWPRLSCPQANQLALEFGDLRVDRNLQISGNLAVGGLSINEFSRDGNLAGNSDLAIPTEQAVKTYIDNQITQVNNTLDTKAALNGAVEQDFAANHLSVSSNLQVSGNLEVNSG